MKTSSLFFALYAALTIATGFGVLTFQLIMWYYVAKFVGIPLWIWGSFAILSALLLIFTNAAKKEFKDYAEVIAKAEAKEQGSF